MFNLEDNPESLSYLEPTEMEKRLAYFKKMREQLLSELSAQAQAD